MYFVLKSLKFFIYLHYSAPHVSDTIVSIIRSFSAAHAVSGPVWCLVRCVLQSCYVVTVTTHQIYLHYSALHVSDTTVSIIRSFSAAHAVFGPVWCLVRCVLQQDWRTQRTKHHTGPETVCAAEKLLMMDTVVSETCRAE